MTSSHKILWKRHWNFIHQNECQNRLCGGFSGKCNFGLKTAVYDPDSWDTFWDTLKLHSTNNIKFIVSYPLWWGQIQLLNNFTKGFSKYFSFRKLQNHLSLMYPKAAVVRLILFCWLVLIDTERYLENWISLPPTPGSPIHRSYRTQVSSVLPSGYFYQHFNFFNLLNNTCTFLEFWRWNYLFHKFYPNLFKHQHFHNLY